MRGPQGSATDWGMNGGKMSFFSKILDKLGFDAGAGKVAEMLATPPAPPKAAGPASGGGAPVVKPISEVDVVTRLEGLASANAQKLNWKTSIVDLMKLLDLDSSLASRKELATELQCPANLMADSAQMNMWLHKAVLRKLAANGGNIPQDLL